MNVIKPPVKLLPPKFPGVEPVGPDGRPPAPTPAPIAPTPGDVVQTPDGPVGGPGMTPPPTLEGIATKIGQMNGEIAQLLRRPSGGQGGEVDISQILDLLEQLIGANSPATEYLLNYYCEKKPDGTPQEPMRITVAAAESKMDSIINRLNALAEMVDKSHRRRAFQCKGKPAGEPVTVIFQEY